MTNLIQDDTTRNAVMFAKMQCDGHGTGLQKSDWIAIINRHATMLFGDASPRNFTKTITEDERGRLFYQALKRSGGSEVAPPPVQKAAEPTHIGPAHAKLHAMSVENYRAK